MTEIDFSEIRSTPKSRGASFEALSVQLFRVTCEVPVGAAFFSLRGDGGDGGVEAYFRAPSGAVIGLQAKYFFKLGSGELAQIKASLESALTNHPTLTEYWVYIPFDVTGRVAGGKRGRSEAERFEQWKVAAEHAAIGRGTPLKIVLCACSSIRSQLLALDAHGGMRRYWFDESLFNVSQIRACLEEAAAFAGPRYSADLDVTTNAHSGLDFFGGIGDFEAWCDNSLAPVLSELESLSGWGDKALSALPAVDAELARTLIETVIQICGEVVAGAGRSEEARRTLTRLSPLLEEVREKQEQEFYARHGRECDTPGFRQYNAEYLCAFPAGEMDAARKWVAATTQLQLVLASAELMASATQSLFLVGPAGVGKTHALVSAAFRRLIRGGLSLVVFGDDFGASEPWEVLRGKLGMASSTSRLELFECMQACAEHTKLPYVIYIDALNESPRSARWKDKLPELLAQCKPYPGVKVCVSARDTYRGLIVDSRFPGFSFEHAGFKGREFEAVQEFAKFYGLEAEITPLFTPEVCNPLFLHLACKALKAEGRTSLDIARAGFSALLESHLKHCDELIRGRLHYSNPKNIARAAAMCLADALTHQLPNDRTWDTCIAALKNVIGAETTAEAFLIELEHEGLVILTEQEDGRWLVRLGYQRFGDLLRATSLVESTTGRYGINIGELAERIVALPIEDVGILESLAAVLPEMTGIEVVDEEIGLDPEMAHRLFVGSLTWRSRESVGQEIDRHVYDALHTPHLWMEVYEALFRLSLVPNHRLNAEEWLGPFLRKSRMVDRDAFLSVAAFESFDKGGAVKALIDAALFADIERWPSESRRLAILALGWLMSCSDRRVRDLSSKAAMRILMSQPALSSVLVDEFRDIDDDYILEGVALAIYSAYLLQRDSEAEFLAALDGLISATVDTPNVLIRDSVRLLGSLLAEKMPLQDMLTRFNAFPHSAAGPQDWPTLQDARSLLDLEDLPANMELWGSQLGPDFWRYQVESKVHKFDIESAGIAYENIACWVMVEALKMGYPGRDGCALHTDIVINQRVGSGRGRKGYADRLGKKYYWIALHRLIGVLADNVPPRKETYSDWAPSPQHLWSVDVRKADITDVRDLSTGHEYPDELIGRPRREFPPHDGDIKSWVRLDDFDPHETSIIRSSSSGDSWVALSFNVRDDDRPASDRSWDKARLGVSVYYSSVFVKGVVPRFAETGSSREMFDSNGASSYRGYLAEYPSGIVFDQMAGEGYFYRGPSGAVFSEVRLLRGAEWEYDYSFSSPERQESIGVPCRELIVDLGLRWDRQRGWVSESGELVAFEAKGKRTGGLFIRRSALNAYLKASGNKLVYRRFANRGFFPPGNKDGSQIDLLTWMQYRLNRAPSLLREESRPFNC